MPKRGEERPPLHTYDAGSTSAADRCRKASDRTLIAHFIGVHYFAFAFPARRAASPKNTNPFQIVPVIAVATFDSDL